MDKEIKEFGKISNIIKKSNIEIEKELEISNFIFRLIKEKNELEKLHSYKKLYQSLKEQIEELNTSIDMMDSKNFRLQLQQKKFIEYLENEIKRLEENDIYEPLQRMALVTHQHNLLKFKEIIGDYK